nr:Transcriptional regulator, AraC family [uncultured bacterium]
MNDIVYVGRHSLMHNVSRHAHESWEFVYCTYGTGTFVFDGSSISYKCGDVVIIPPMVPHSNASEGGFRNIHVNMTSPRLTLKKPALISDDSNHFLLDAFSAVCFHFYSDRKQRIALLSIYGDLICCYLAAYQTVQQRSAVVERIENDIIANYADCDYELDTYLRSLPFSYDYLRKLFQKELGVTPHKYLTDKRLQIAAEALVNAENSGSTIADIALMCGFRDPLYFSKLFKKEYGVAPSFYPKARQQADNQQSRNAGSVRIAVEDA